LIVSGVSELHSELAKRGAPIVKPLESTPWGTRFSCGRSRRIHPVLFRAAIS
jgi:hypothetical protein